MYILTKMAPNLLKKNVKISMNIVALQIGYRVWRILLTDWGFDKFCWCDIMSCSSQMRGQSLSCWLNSESTLSSVRRTPASPPACALSARFTSRYYRRWSASSPSAKWVGRSCTPRPCSPAPPTPSGDPPRLYTPGKSRKSTNSSLKGLSSKVAVLMTL